MLASRLAEANPVGSNPTPCVEMLMDGQPFIGGHGWTNRKCMAISNDHHGGSIPHAYGQGFDRIAIRSFGASRSPCGGGDRCDARHAEPMEVQIDGCLALAGRRA